MNPIKKVKTELTEHIAPAIQAYLTRTQSLGARGEVKSAGSNRLLVSGHLDGREHFFEVVVKEVS